MNRPESTVSSRSWGSAAIESAGVRVRPPAGANVEEEEVVGVAPTCRPSRGKGVLRVVIADDCRDAADTLATLMDLWGHEVRVAYSGAAVLGIVATYRPHVLLLDIAMPRMDGLVLARQLRRLRFLEHPLLVAITGYADYAHRLLGLEAGFDLYLAKPVEPVILQQLMQVQKDRCAVEPRRI
jgi:CheY-like chemotaxis protein